MKLLVAGIAIVSSVLNGNVLAQTARPLNLDLVVSDAFAATHDGWSSDEVLVNPELNGEFIEECRRQLAEAAKDVTEKQLNWKLLNLRKAKKLTTKVTRRSHDKHDAYRHAAEIAARSMEDKHRQNIDRVLCDPRLRAEFDKMASRLAPDTETRLLRKSALGLRKARRLKPEFVVRAADCIHAFKPESNVRLATMRRAYESELIESRKPRFNVRP